MKTLKKIFLILILLITQSILSQNQTTAETIDYINNLINDKTREILYSNGNLESRSYYKGQNFTERIIAINDISKVRVSTSNFIGIYLDCYYENDCVSAYLTEGRPIPMPYFMIETKSNSIAEKLSNALRYLIEKEKKTVSQNDPFSSFSEEIKDNRSININDLKIGMTKEAVFKILNTQPTLDLIESGYEVYKVKKKEQYFLYFSNNKLNRVDKGVSIYDTIIIID